MDKEGRIKEAAARYYRQRAVKKALVEAARGREIAPRYFNAFGTRPDILLYDGDVESLANRGATSFHCSEERWRDPLKLKVELSRQELDSLREGWDFLIDIDCKFIEYSKITASLLIKALRFHGVNTFGIKFSGGTGFHLCVAYEAFPKTIYGRELRLQFPDAARAMLDYLKRIIEKELASRLQDLDSAREISQMIGKSEKELLVGEKFNPYSIVNLDSGLISSRHLFRMPFSLNEKTSLVSIVISAGEIEKFNPQIAKPSDFIRCRPFIIAPEKEEGRELLMQALDWKGKVGAVIGKEYAALARGIRGISPGSYGVGFGLEAQGGGIIEIKGRVGEEDFPPCIKKALEGLKGDGRKRALFILINFFRCINMPDGEIEERLREWDSRNGKPLGEGYLRSQLNWYRKQEKKFPPPNCDHPFYKDIGIYTPECERMKNPLSYVARRLRMRGREGGREDDGGDETRVGKGRARRTSSKDI